jgi:flagellar hook-associated protein 3 FlgL
MITRVTDKMRFDILNSSISSTQSQYSVLMEKMATLKQVNKPSDDPLGMGKILDYRSAIAQISNYKEKIESAQSWINTTETSLSNVNDILMSVKETAVAQASATSTASTRQIAADSLQPLIDQILSLANTKFGNRYLFSGTKTDTEPFTSTSSATRIDTVVSASGNTFNGAVTSGGTYTGSTNKTYAVKIITGGALATATYQISSDGGKTWGATLSDLSAPVTVGDGIQMTFTAGSVDLAANDMFTVHAYASGYYNGNGEELSSDVGNDTAINYSITGEAVFANQGQGTVDIFTVLNDLKTALQNNDATGISNQLSCLDDAMNQINRYIGQCGTRTNSLDISSSSLDEMDIRLTELKSNIEDADVTALATEYQMKQLALQAAYTVAGDLGRMTILNFFK